MEQYRLQTYISRDCIYTLLSEFGRKALILALLWIDNKLIYGRKDQKNTCVEDEQN